MNRTGLLFLCLISLILSLISFNSDVSAMGENFFVSPDGTSSDPCTQSSPCDYLTGIGMADHGDSVYFKFGSYEGVTDPMINLVKGVSLYGGWDGASSGPVTLNPANQSTINGGSVRRQLIINDTVGTHSIKITGFTFLSGKSTGSGGAINIINGTVTIEGNSFINNKSGSSFYGGAIYSSTSGPVIIRNNYFEGNEALGGGAISISLAEIPTAPIIIEQNRFTGGAANYGTAIFVSNASILFTRNLLIDVKGSVSAISLSTYESIPPSTITNNIVVRSKTAFEAVGKSTEKHKVWNNTFVDCDDIAIYGWGAAEIEFINNIITDTPISITTEGGSEVSGSNNLFYNNGDDADLTLKLLNPITYNDPLFVDPASDDYHIQKGSPAMDQGATVALDVDFDGDERPIGDYYDIGADEVVGTQFLFLPLILR